MSIDDPYRICGTASAFVGRAAPWHIVFQHADAFVARTLG